MMNEEDGDLKEQTENYENVWTNCIKIKLKSFILYD